jgi:hypothetical protein
MNAASRPLALDQTLPAAGETGDAGTRASDQGAPSVREAPIGDRLVLRFCCRSEAWREGSRMTLRHIHNWKRANDWDWGPGTITFECVACGGLRVIRRPRR